MKLIIIIHFIVSFVDHLIINICHLKYFVFLSKNNGDLMLINNQKKIKGKQRQIFLYFCIY